MHSLKILIILIIATIINSQHPFETCSSDNKIDIKSLTLTPDKPIGGEDFSCKVNGKSNVDIENGELKVSVRLMGIKVATINMGICEVTNCPIKSGDNFIAEVHYKLPKETPSGVEVTVEMDVYDENKNKIACLKSKVDTDYTTESSLLLTENNNNNKDKIKFLFEFWLKEFAIKMNIGWYPILNENHKDEYKKRFNIFFNNIIDIIHHNHKFRLGKTTYKKSLNQFAHLQSNEFVSQYINGYNEDLLLTTNQKIKKSFFDYIKITLPSKNFFSFRGSDNKELPTEIDWVEKGAVTQVKDQQSCGSCWAFSAVGALEGAYFLKYGELKMFSEQQLVSCDKDCYGCGGGLMTLAFDFVKQNGGLCSEEDYPYKSGTTSSNGWCKPTTCEVDPKSKIDSYIEVTPNSETALEDAVSKGPTSVAIYADRSFQFYSSGVLTAECGDKLNHGVLAVGYGTDNDVKFWKIKNSWGKLWGESGYIRIQRGKQVPAGGGECGILLNAAIPSV